MVLVASCASLFIVVKESKSTSCSVDWLRNETKKVANIIRPLDGQSPHHIKNTQQFMEYSKKVRLEPGKVMPSYDVKTLFTSVPVDPSIAIVQCKLQQDPYYPMTSMSIPQIVTLLEFCLKNTYFLFQGKYYGQANGAAMGSPIVPSSPTYSWKSLKSNLSTLSQPLIYGSGM